VLAVPLRFEIAQQVRIDPLRFLFHSWQIVMGNDLM
jgi:hypothetical protein